MKRPIFGLLIAIFFWGIPSFADSQVNVITVEGVINPVVAEFIENSIDKATKDKAEVLVIELDTPGGLDTSMRSIIKKMVSSDVPIVVYVYPSGGRAASAGVFITIAAHIAAMTSGTNIGAAHPVGMGGKMDKTMVEKVENDAVAYIKSLAEKRKRNPKWAEDAVRKSASITEKEALALKVIDLVASDLNSLLSGINGMKVDTPLGEKTLKTTDAKVVRKEIGIRYKILKVLSDPNIAYILMILGFYGLFFELTNPGAILPGVVGALCLILAFYSFQVLPVNYAGLLLIILAIILFILEVKIASYGMLTIGGIISMVIGSLMLFESPAPFMKLSLAVVLPAAIMTAIFFTLTFSLAFKAYKRKPVTGSEGLVGMEGVAKTKIHKNGTVFVHGELWRAWSEEPIKEGASIIVETVEGLKLKIRERR
ncbi:MAG: nodulation protein NfeD [Nitrospirae bacterium]|nr:nodulation protein NfeD [Nitrospirota bacterium]